MSGEDSKRQRISVEMSEPMVELIDQLKGEYGARSRGRVLEMLLQDLLDPGDGSTGPEETSVKDEGEPEATTSTDEITSLVLIGSGSLLHNAEPSQPPDSSAPSANVSSGIDLPGFVSKRTGQLKATLRSPQQRDSAQNDPLVSTVDPSDLRDASAAAEDHWRSLYGQPPGPTVIEASMTWLARDVWSSTDASDGRPFTWSAANAAVETLCAGWESRDPSLGRVMAVAGALEDPFATSSLAERMPTLIRRFVNRFRRSRQVTSFETLESTMTVHGALKLLGLSTRAGTAVTLSSIRDAYKQRALEEHPDAGGSTDAMRRLNEAYRLLRELYRNR
ncbi:molecular chaperone DnaJ [Synechococcus sp. MU1611]|nr:molecular chaperone DnaJ [Synechococcus sp. MU1650]MCB4410875.1 molecular chaperone DnaJ [Synechococcus sp. MU1611]